MSSTRIWAGIVMLVCSVMGTLLGVCFLIGLGGCGGSTGLAGGKGASGAAAVAEAGAAGSDNETGGAAGNAGAGAGGGGGSVSTATLVAVELTPTLTSAAIGTQALIHATALYSNQMRQDVTGVATWSSDSPKTASVSAGLVRALAPGSAMISATFAGLTGGAQVTVPMATVKALTVTPSSAIAAIQGTVAFQAVVTLSDASTQDVTATATWTSSKEAVATIAGGGLATGVSAGSVTISAASAGITGSATLTVSAATLASIAVTPTNPTLGVGVNATFTATGTFSDGSVSDVSSEAVWTSNAPTIASIDTATHTASTVAPGSTTISATIDKVVGSTTLTVTSASLTSIAVAPSTSMIAIGGTSGLTATGTYSDNSTVDLTQSVTWASSDPTIVTVANGTGSQGVITGIAGGGATISATLGTVSGTATVNVTAAKLVSIAITPADPTLPVGTRTQLSAAGTYSDNSVVDITSSVTWSTDDPKIATVSAAAVSPGLANAVALGTTNAHAMLGAVSASTSITVTAAKLVSIAITPADPNLPAGTSEGLSATGTYSDASTLETQQARVALRRACPRGRSPLAQCSAR